MINIEDIERYLPQYLSQGGKEELFRGLNDFPNVYDRMYTDYLKKEHYLFQGDCIDNLNFIFYAGNSCIQAKGMLLSNTCDLSLENERITPINMSYVPVIDLQKYSDMLLEKTKDKNKVDSYMKNIREQRITHLFYLPGHGERQEAVAMLDHPCSFSDTSEVLKNISSRRIFTLSDLGFYLFLLKISIHFTRIRESVERHYCP